MSNPGRTVHQVRERLQVIQAATEICQETVTREIREIDRLLMAIEADPDHRSPRPARDQEK